jgi:hypothetical protein
MLAGIQNTLMGKDKIVEKFSIKTPYWKETLCSCINNIENKI